MTRRLESSARDYAIACLARGLPMEATWAMMATHRDYERAVTEVWGTNEGWRASQVARLVRARVALYLRMMRRVEAWETWERTGAVSQLRGTGGKRSFRYVDMGDHVALVAFATPWRPLWTSAPPHEPGVTARMRRSAPPQRANE